MNQPILQSEIDYIRVHYPSEGGRACAEALRCKVKRIYGITHKIGLKHTSEEIGLITSRANQRKDEDHDVRFVQFIHLERPEVAYLLGYMWADGYVRRNKARAYIFSLAIVKKDYEVIKDVLDRLGHWRIHSFINAAGTPSVAIQTSNIPLIKWLLEMDYGVKLYVAPTKIVNYISEVLRHYFWRGYMDGDGHFRIGGGLYHFSFTADYLYDWIGHTSLLDTLGIQYKISHRIQKEGRKSDVVCSNMAGTYAFGRYIYANREVDGIGLDRKYNKWLICKKRVEDVQRTEAVVLTQSPAIPLDDKILLDIVREHSGVVNQRTIAKHYGLKGWQVSEMTQRLCKKKLITFIGDTSSVRYVALPL